MKQKRPLKSKKNAGAWMVTELTSGLIGTVSGTVECAAVLREERYWRE